MRILPTLTVVAAAGALLLAGVPWPAAPETGSQLLEMRWKVLRQELRELRTQQRAREQELETMTAAQEALATDYASLQAAHASLVDEAEGLRVRTSELDREKGQVASLLERINLLESTLSEERAELNARITAEAQRLTADLDGVRAAQETFRAEAAASTAKGESVARLRNEVLGPVFQLSGGEAVGSAVLIRRVDEGEDPHYLALSCYHVVRDILEDRSAEAAYPTQAFDAVFTDLNASERRYPARMIEWDVASDLALLRIETSTELGPVARIAPLAHAEGIGVFAEVYTVGCPLGTAAQATQGMVTRETWEVAGEPYWMVSSPAYFGNSGGGVFDAESLELIGIFAKIYTHGSYRPQVITHMGLAVPLTRLHSWLTEVGYAHLLPRD